MKKTTKDKETERLKKQVEKLKSKNESLKRDKRSLIGKLATAKAKADKYHDALKKKATPKDGLGRGTCGLMVGLLDGGRTQRWWWRLGSLSMLACLLVLGKWLRYSIY